MKIIKNNIWNYYKPDSYIGITTNGFVKKTGECVMGRGIALEAKTKFPELPFLLGKHIKTVGNTVAFFEDLKLFSFPVKHNWWEKADLNLIEESAKDLAERFRQGYELGADLPKLYLPKPGCGNGQLLWKDVEPILDEYLSPLVIIIDRN